MKKFKEKYIHKLKDGEVFCDRCTIIIGKDHIFKEPNKHRNRNLCKWCLDDVMGKSARNKMQGTQWEI